MVTINKDFDLYQVFMYDLLRQTVLISPICLLFTKIIEKAWSRDVTHIWVLTHKDLISSKFINNFKLFQVFIC